MRTPTAARSGAGGRLSTLSSLSRPSDRSTGRRCSGRARARSGRDPARAPLAEPRRGTGGRRSCRRSRSRGCRRRARRRGCPSRPAHEAGVRAGRAVRRRARHYGGRIDGVVRGVDAGEYTALISGRPRLERHAEEHELARTHESTVVAVAGPVGREVPRERRDLVGGFEARAAVAGAGDRHPLDVDRRWGVRRSACGRRRRSGTSRRRRARGALSDGPDDGVSAGDSAGALRRFFVP
jgi:hypothetical protein